MKSTRLTLTCLAITAAMSLSACAATDRQHNGLDSNAVVAQDATDSPAQAMSGMNGMKEQMKAMKEMHKKMMATKTPEEHDALMVEHKMMMQDSMAMMDRMGHSEMSGMQADPESHQKMMKEHMDMMQSMMQMMMDRTASTEDAM